MAQNSISKRTREQVINDKYILGQQMTRRNKNVTESGMKINKFTSVWKISEEEKRQRIYLLQFQKQQQQKKGVLKQEMEAEL